MSHLSLATCIPSRNGKETIVRLIQSIKASSELPDEIIVSDNSSVDGTPFILADLFGDSVKISTNAEDIGFDDNVVKSVQLSHCDYVWILGDHCVIPHDAIKELKLFIHNNHYPDVVIVDFSLINGSTGDLIRKAYSSQSSPCIIQNLESYCSSAAFHAYVSCFIFKRSSFISCQLDRYSNSLFIHCKCALELIQRGGILYEYPLPMVFNVSKPNFSKPGSIHILILVKTIQLVDEYRFPQIHKFLYLHRVCMVYLHEKILYSVGMGYIPRYNELIMVIKSLWWHPLMWAILLLDLIIYPLYRSLKKTSRAVFSIT